MLQNLRGIVLIAAMILNCGVALAQKDPNSANLWIPGCHLFVEDKPGPRDLLLNGSTCAGIIFGIAFAAPDLCIPNGVTNGQKVRVVVQYIENRPARMHESLFDLALEALRAAWPCKN
jgi:hypothetical protein